MPYPTANLGFTGHTYESFDTTTTLMKFKLWLPMEEWNEIIYLIYVVGMDVESLAEACLSLLRKVRIMMPTQ